MEVCLNHCEWQMESQIVMASCIWFCRQKSVAPRRYVDVTYRILVFNQTLVVTAQRDQEQNARHVLETVDPFPSFALLPTDVDHEHFVIAELEQCFRDANCSRTTVDDVLFRRDVRGIE